jgi:hypothetical protein
MGAPVARFMVPLPNPQNSRAPLTTCLVGRFTLLSETKRSDRTTGEARPRKAGSPAENFSKNTSTYVCDSLSIFQVITVFGLFYFHLALKNIL